MNCDQLFEWYNHVMLCYVRCVDNVAMADLKKLEEDAVSFAQQAIGLDQQGLCDMAFFYYCVCMLAYCIPYTYFYSLRFSNGLRCYCVLWAISFCYSVDQNCGCCDEAEIFYKGGHLVSLCCICTFSRHGRDTDRDSVLSTVN